MWQAGGILDRGEEAWSTADQAGPRAAFAEIEGTGAAVGEAASVAVTNRSSDKFNSLFGFVNASTRIVHSIKGA
jgi:hypothetical protein